MRAAGLGYGAALIDEFRLPMTQQAAGAWPRRDRKLRDEVEAKIERSDVTHGSTVSPEINKERNGSGRRATKGTP